MDQVELIIKNDVEVSEEHSTKSIVVGSIRDLLDTNEAVFLAWKTVKITFRFYFYGCVLQREFDWLKGVVKFVARFASYHVMSIIFHMRVNWSVIFSHVF